MRSRGCLACLHVSKHVAGWVDRVLWSGAHEAAEGTWQMIASVIWLDISAPVVLGAISITLYFLKENEIITWHPDREQITRQTVACLQSPTLLSTSKFGEKEAAMRFLSRPYRQPPRKQEAVGSKLFHSWATLGQGIAQPVGYKMLPSFSAPHILLQVGIGNKQIISHRWPPEHAHTNMKAASLTLVPANLKTSHSQYCVLYLGPTIF